MTDWPNDIHWTRCEDLISQLKALHAEAIPDDPRAREGLGGGVDPSIDDVLDAVRLSGIDEKDFIELDERPGRFDSNYRDNQWHRLLRKARNADNDLFDILRGES
jgi:hypothetical protein